MGRLPARVTAVMANLAHPNSELEDICHAILAYPDGAMGLLSTSVIHHGEHKAFEFQCEKGAISLPFRVDASLSLPNGFPRENPELARQVADRYDKTPALPEEGHVVQLRNMVDVIEKGGKLLLDGAGARQPLELICALYQSAFAGRTVELPLSPRDPDYSMAGRVRQARRFNHKTRDIDSFPPTPITL